MLGKECKRSVFVILLLCEVHSQCWGQSDSKGLEKNANIQNPASTSAKSTIQNASTSASDRSEEFIENGIHYSQHVCMQAASRHDEPFPNSVSALSAKSCILDASVDSAKELIEDGRHYSQHVCNQVALPVHSCPSNSAQSIVPSAIDRVVTETLAFLDAPDLRFVSVALEKIDQFYATRLDGLEKRLAAAGKL